MRYIAGFFRFWYDFLIGDSWQIALGVGIVVVAAKCLVTMRPQLAPVAGPGFFVALLAVFCGAILREHRIANKQR